MSHPPAEVDLDDAVVRGLLADQHPDLATEALGERFEGWDNVAIRLGARRAVRLPRVATAAPLIEREIRWLPRMSRGWAFGAPVPERVGEPGRGYPWRWTVVPWFEGADAAVEALDADGAEDLGRALRQVHTPAPDDAPDTPWRTRPLRDRADTTSEGLAGLARLCAEGGHAWDEAATRAALAEAADLAWRGDTWVHADVHLKNLIVRGGRLAAIVDWGEAAAGDPAQDAGQLWLALDGRLVDRAFDAYGPVDEAFLARARGEAIATAVRLLGTGDAAFMASGWNGLTNLGLADGAGPGA